jgi:hypothetical protein
MLLASFGSPSALAYATSNVVRCIGNEIFGAHFYIQATNRDEFKQHWHSVDADQRKCVVFFSDCPHKDVTDMIAAVRAPVVVVVEDFAAIFDYVRRSRNMDFAPAARFSSQVVCALKQIFRSPNIMRISPADYGRSLASFVEMLLSFYGAQCNDAQFNSIMASLAPDGSAVHTVSDYVNANFPHWRDDENDAPLAPDQQLALDCLIDAYRPLVSGQPLEVAVWPVSMFLKWDVDGAFIDGPIELLGPGRFIICGPYLHLPVGAWRMTVQIEVEECLSDNQIGADIFSERILTAIEARLPPSGRFSFNLDFDVVNPLAPVEIRMQLLTGAIEGRLSLVDVRLTRRGD